MKLLRSVIGAACVGAMCACSAQARLIVPDNGSGTATVPPPTGVYEVVPSPTGGPSGWTIVDGLPVGSTLHSALAEWGGFVFGSDVPGGTLGGNVQNAASPLALHFQGTGVFAAYTRNITLPMNTQTHSAPRGLPFSSPQNFNTVLFQFTGQITGDPDFDLLRITAGDGFGLPSPGQTSLTSAGPGMWAVDSFFDITYRIDFVGRPGGPFAGMSGSTTRTTRMAIPTPASGVLLGTFGLLAARRRRA